MIGGLEPVQLNESGRVRGGGLKTEKGGGGSL